MQCCQQDRQDVGDVQEVLELQRRRGKLVELKMSDEQDISFGGLKFIKMGDAIVFRTLCGEFHIIEESNVMKRISIHGAQAPVVLLLPRKILPKGVLPRELLTSKSRALPAMLTTRSCVHSELVF